MNVDEMGLFTVCIHPQKSAGVVGHESGRTGVVIVRDRISVSEDKATGGSSCDVGRRIAVVDDFDDVALGPSSAGSADGLCRDSCNRAVSVGQHLVDHPASEAKCRKNSRCYGGPFPNPHAVNLTQK